MVSHPSSDLRRAVVDAIEHGDFSQAKDLLEHIRKTEPPDADVLNNLAVVYNRLNLAANLQLLRLEEALAIDPHHPEVQKNLAEVNYTVASSLLQKGQFEAAIVQFEKVLSISPKHVRSLLERGRCLYNLGRMEEAIKSYTRAASLEPNLVAAYSGLGVAYMELKLLAEAKGAFQQVLRLDPHSSSAFMHLGLLANMTGLSGVGVNMIRRALELNPNSPEAHNNLGLILREQGEIAEAFVHYQKTKAHATQNPDYYSGYLLTLNYLPGLSPEAIAIEHRLCDVIFPLKQYVHAVKNRDLHRKLRVGYLSPDFRTHSVAYFIVGLLESHNVSQYDVTGYYTGRESDGMTKRIASAVEKFVPCYGWPDEVLAKRIKEDEIDVIVELSGHTCGHRLALLRNRIAPVQMTYLGYPNTTGLSSMDWRITDAIADPQGSDVYCSEKLARIENGFLAYSVSEVMQSLEVTPLLAKDDVPFTFGCFNNLAKVNDGVLAVWAQILKQVPTARLVIKARGMRDERVQTRILQIFKNAGIESSRIDLLGHELLLRDHLACYQKIDLALDTFPYAGTTTTCEAMWMGVPIVTLSGDHHAGRVGASLLTQVGLEFCITHSAEAYIKRAVEMASDLPRLAELRQGLRQQMLRSPLMDSKRLATEMDRVIRHAWIQYCQNEAR